jgi:seryl-tRNA synthetase
MRNVILSLFLCTCTSAAYCDSAKEQQVKELIQNLIDVDEKIENLVKKRAQLQGEAAADLERGSESILPRAAKRTEREIAGLQGQIQQMNQELQELESKREQILLGLQ